MRGGVDFHILPGEIVTIVGPPNGSGKSTLLRLLLGVLPASTGRVTRQAGLRVGYVPQKLAIDASFRCRLTVSCSCPDARRKQIGGGSWRRSGSTGWSTAR